MVWKAGNEAQFRALTKSEVDFQITDIYLSFARFFSVDDFLEAVSQDGHLNHFEIEFKFDSKVIMIKQGEDLY